MQVAIGYNYIWLIISTIFKLLLKQLFSIL